jgi:RNA polymerase sigma-70 factor (ECF subfamily)
MVPGLAGTTPEDSEQDDAAVVRRVLAGEQGAYGALVDRYGRRLFWSCRRLLGDPDEAEDVVQETFVRAYRHLGEYDPARRFYTWIYTIARNRCLNVLRSRKAWGMRRLDPGGDPAAGDADGGSETPAPQVASTDDPSAGVERRELAAALAECLETLPEEQRACFELRHGEELRYEEIAEVLAVPVGTVMSRLARARAKMRACLSAKGVA